MVAQLLEVNERRRFWRSAAVPSVTTPSKVKVYWLWAFLTPASVASLNERSPGPPVSYAIQIFVAAFAVGVVRIESAISDAAKPSARLH